MEPTPTLAEPAHTDEAPGVDAPGVEAQRLARYRAVLDELLDMGMDIARTLHRRIAAQHGVAREAETAALPPAPAAGAPDLTLQFDRVSRAVRRTVALARTLDEPAPPPASAARDPARDTGADRLRTAARKRIIREVEDTIGDHAEGDAARHLRAELAERLDAPDLDDDIASKPVPEVIADIVRDLGIEHMQGCVRWQRRSPAALAHLAARAARRPDDPPLPEPDPEPEPRLLPRSLAFHLYEPPPLIRKGLDWLEDQGRARRNADRPPQPG